MGNHAARLNGRSVLSPRPRRQPVPNPEPRRAAATGHGRPRPPLSGVAQPVAEERLEFLNNSICGPATQLSNLEAEEGSAWAREEAGLPVWLHAVTASSKRSVASSPARVVQSNGWVEGESYEPAVLVLDEVHVAEQQRRLIRFVEQAA